MTGRKIAIGDVHGCTHALKTLVDSLELTNNDTLVTLGDYVGKGDDSNGTLEYLIKLKSRCNLITLLGNHDFLMRSVLRNELSVGAWFSLGGQSVLTSYGTDSDVTTVPESHRVFLEKCKLFHEMSTHIFVHACYQAELPLAETDEFILLWERLTEVLPDGHCSGKIAVVGHTRQDSGEILDAGHLVCIDTGCVSGGRLTALDVMNKVIWRTDRLGRSVERVSLHGCELRFK